MTHRERFKAINRICDLEKAGQIKRSTAKAALRAYATMAGDFKDE